MLHPLRYREDCFETLCLERHLGLDHLVVLHVSPLATCFKIGHQATRLTYFRSRLCFYSLYLNHLQDSILVLTRFAEKGTLLGGNL